MRDVKIADMVSDLNELPVSKGLREIFIYPSIHSPVQSLVLLILIPLILTDIPGTILATKQSLSSHRSIYSNRGITFIYQIITVTDNLL